MNTDLEPKLLRTFCVVAEELHFRRAAARLHTTQSAVSQQVKELERRVGCELLERSRRGVRLSKAGEVFLIEARQVLERSAAAAALAREVAQGRRGTVTIGLIGAATFEAAPRILASAETHAPDLDVRFIELSASRQLEALRSADRRIDAGLVRAESRAAGLSFRTVLREPVLCLMPEDHRLAVQDSVTIADLEGEPVLNLSREHDPAGHDAYLAMYRAAGFEPNLVMEISQIATILFAVAIKRCVALGPSGWRVLHREGVVYRPITAPAPTVETRLVWNPQQVSSALSRLLELTGEGQLLSKP